jgi:very-short-patch-repair endonuclease
VKRRQHTDAQILLQIHLRELGLETEREYSFMPGRRWKFDLASVEQRLAFEADGGKFHGGHRRGQALEDDYERQNTAIMEGWRILRFTNDQILCGKAKEFVGKWL